MIIGVDYHPSFQQIAFLPHSILLILKPTGVFRNTGGRDYSERRAWITSMRAARDAGSIEATTAAASWSKAVTM